MDALRCFTQEDRVKIKAYMHKHYGGNTMVPQTAYCVKCREKSVIKDAVEVKMKNGRPALKGVCSVCGTGVYKILPASK